MLNIGGERRARPNLVGDPELSDSERTLEPLVQHRCVRRLQPRATSVRQRRRRVSCVDRDTSIFDFTLAKNFHFSERGYVQFRTEVFNAFNHANFGPPNIARDSSGFGQILTAG